MRSTWFLRDAEQTRAAGAALARAIAAMPLTAPLVVTLHGELGAGKTTLVGGFMHALGFAGPVRSPTYTLMEPYELPSLMVWHLDLYRLTDPVQLEDIGLRDHMQPNTVLLVEWAERGGHFFAQPQVALTLRYATHGATEGRELQLETDQPQLAALVHSVTF